MRTLYRYAVLLAVAGFVLSGFAQETWKEAAPKQQSAKKGALSDKDAGYMRRLAQADLAEVQAGKLAAGKASSDEVKKFAQHMVDDHGKHMDEARTMAKSKGMPLPATPAKKHQDAMKKLRSAKADDFDRAYMRQMINDHQDALKLVRDTAKNAKDKELKAAAEKAAPVIEKHLEEAKRVSASLK